MIGKNFRIKPMELDFTKLRFGCSKVHIISKQNKKKVMSDKDIEALHFLKTKESLNQREQKKHDALIKKLEITDFDKMMATAISYLFTKE